MSTVTVFESVAVRLSLSVAPGWSKNELLSALALNSAYWSGESFQSCVPPAESWTNSDVGVAVIGAATPEGVKKVVAQQFDVARQVLAHGLVPIVEPEVNIHSATKAEAEAILERLAAAGALTAGLAHEVRSPLNAIGLAAQNMHWEKEGAYTGEISAAMLVAAGCRYVIIGL